MTNVSLDSRPSTGTPQQRGSVDRSRPSATVRSVARGLALFLGGFSLLNVLRALLIDRFDANIWWIDLQGVQPSITLSLILLFSLTALAFGANPAMSSHRRRITIAATSLVGIVVVKDVIVFYDLLLKGEVSTDIPIPFSLVVLAALSLILSVAMFDHPPAERSRSWRPIAVTVAACLVAFPLMQIVCFGRTDYSRPADTIVVLGAKAYADGRPSVSLADRVRKGVELYRNGLAHTIIFSGGPGEGAIHETEAMKAMAVRMGVSEQDIILDRDGLNTRATARNTVRIAQHDHIDRVLVVSNFYHLPRIKMSFQQEGRQVFTVPANDSAWTATPRQIVREILGLWAYYLT